MVGLYFAVMAALSFYGLHRYALLALYYRGQSNGDPLPAGRFEDLPRVTVQLPVFNERFVVEALIEAVCRLDYPREKLDIQVLDDSNDETRSVARQAVERMAWAGEPIRYFHRAQRNGYKAGALDAGLTEADGELIAVFDADFTPPADFLRRTVDYFCDPKIGMVQARWGFRNREQSLLTRVQAMLLDGHFVFEHGARFRSGRFFNFNGTAGVLRKQTIEDAGGWQFDTLTEDTDLSYRAQLKGWKFVYAPNIVADSELPLDVASFQVQQARWAKGLMQTAIKLLPRLLAAELPLRVKTEAFFHLTANVSYPLMALMSALLVPAMLIRFEHWDGRLLWLDGPLFLATFSSLASFYLLAQRELGVPNWRRRANLIPSMIALGIGLTLSNAAAVIEAWMGRRTPFERTAKYSSDPRRLSQARRFYGAGAGWLPWANLLCASYFAAALVLSLALGAWGTTPFLALFAYGFGWTGLLALRQSQQRLAERPLHAGLGETQARSSALSA